MIWPSPIDWSQELHSSLLGDHFDGLRNDLLPLSLEAQPDPTELDLGIVVVVEMIDLLKLSHFCDTEKNSKIITNFFGLIDVFLKNLVIVL